MNKRYFISSFFNTQEFDVSDILQIVMDHKVDYSTNSNGIFINLSLIDDTIIDRIYDKLISLHSSNISNESITMDVFATINTEVNEEVNLGTDNLKLSQVDKLLMSLSKQTITI